MSISPRLGLGLDFFPGECFARLFGWRRCRGDRSLVVLKSCAVLEADVLCGGFGIDEVLSVSSFCVGARLLCESIIAGCARDISKDADFATEDMVAEG